METSWTTLLPHFRRGHGLSDAADDVAANIGGSIRWRKKDKPEGQGGNGDG